MVREEAIKENLVFIGKSSVVLKLKKPENIDLKLEIVSPVTAQSSMTFKTSWQAPIVW